MAEYIERDAAIQSIEEVVMAMESWITDYQAQRRGLMTAITIVTDVPAADVRPVRHGRWKKVIEDDKYYHMECSRCCGRPLRNRWVDDAELSTFCPWCGALMDKGGDGDV